MVDNNKYKGYIDTRWGKIFYFYGLDHNEHSNWRRVRVTGTPGHWMWEGTCGKGDVDHAKDCPAFNNTLATCINRPKCGGCIFTCLGCGRKGKSRKLKDQNGNCVNCRSANFKTDCGGNREQIWQKPRADEYIMVDWKNYYQIIGLGAEQNNLIGKSVISESKVSGMGTRDAFNNEELNPVRKKINTAAKRATIRVKNKSEAEIRAVEEARLILLDNTVKTH